MNFKRLRSLRAKKAHVWPVAVTVALTLITFLLSLTATITNFESGLLEHILLLQSGSFPDFVGLMRSSPLWLVFLMHALFMWVYVTKYSRNASHSFVILTLIWSLLGLLMLEVMLAQLAQFFLPLAFPILVVWLLASTSTAVDTYGRYITGEFVTLEPITEHHIQYLIDRQRPIAALLMLRQSIVNSEVLALAEQIRVHLATSRNGFALHYLDYWLSGHVADLDELCDTEEPVEDPRVVAESFFPRKLDLMLEDDAASPDVDATALDIGFVGAAEQLAAESSKVVPIGNEKSPSPIELSTSEAALLSLGHYRVVNKIAEGATAIVYEALDSRSNKRVALKMMSAVAGQSVELDRIRHWLREAAIVSKLDHLNIVKIHDSEMMGNNAYIAMEFIPGHSLDARLRRRQYLTAIEAIRVCKAVLQGLIEAHSKGVVHGDIKPANIMYNSDKDTYIITDFGAAYIEKQDHLAENIIIGTPAFMSPEQLEGKKLDGRSDLFSLAVTVYHLLAGYLPFSGNNLAELKQSIVRQEVDLENLSVPAGLAAILAKALQKKPYVRFADAEQMLTSVEYCEAKMKLEANQAVDF